MKAGALSVTEHRPACSQPAHVQVTHVTFLRAAPGRYKSHCVTAHCKISTHNLLHNHDHLHQHGSLGLHCTGLLAAVAGGFLRPKPGTKSVRWEGSMLNKTCGNRPVSCWTGAALGHCNSLPVVSLVQAYCPVQPAGWL